jgi:hypothetical protein
MKRSLILIFVLMVPLAVWAVGRAGAPEGTKGETVRSRVMGREQQFKLAAIRVIGDQLGKLRAGITGGGGGMQLLSAEERAEFKEKWENASEQEKKELRAEMREKLRARTRSTRVVEEQLTAIKMIEEQIVNLKGEDQLRAEFEESIGVLKAIHEAAVKENATETASRLEKLIAEQQKELENKLERIEQERKRLRAEGPRLIGEREGVRGRRKLPSEERMKMRERWGDMSEEEREQFKAKMRERLDTQEQDND